ncbi:MAG: hypothetical protein FWF94_08195 [Oscillospiraceae bacterium]|nr:hypothetical protein [Oscillospiraceae bacterium]
MDKLKIYLDNCCYNRPFDDLSQAKVRNEATAKVFIQSLIKFDSVTLYSSFMLFKEINDNPNESNKEHILRFVTEYSSFFVSDKRENDIIPISEDIMKKGIKKKDATHLACSIFSKCDFFITTDRRLTKYKTDKIEVLNPIDFVKKWGGMT